MPRNVRNYWLEGYVDGRATLIAAGPRAHDGGLELRIHMRDDGGILRNAVRVYGLANDDTLHIVVEDETGTVVHEHKTTR